MPTHRLENQPMRGATLSLTRLIWFITIAVLGILVVGTDAVAADDNPSSVPLIIPIDTILASRQSMARDMGKASVNCPKLRGYLQELKEEFFRKEAVMLARRGLPIGEYEKRWNDAFNEGTQSPLPRSACASDGQAWQAMLQMMRALTVEPPKN